MCCVSVKEAVVTSRSHPRLSRPPPASVARWRVSPGHDPAPPLPAGYVCSATPPQPRPAITGESVNAHHAMEDKCHLELEHVR